VQLANLFQLDAEPMAERTFGSQFFQQGFGLIERIWGNILAFEQVSEAALNFILGKQGDLRLRDPQKSAIRMRRKWPRPRGPTSPFILLAAAVHARAM
jgi:hypothetical protein